MYRILIFIILSFSVIAANAQVAVGVRNSRYIYGEYALHNNYVFTLEQSVYAEKLSFQYVRLYAGYKGHMNRFAYSGQGFFGTAYNGAYYSCGVLLMGKYDITNRLYTEDAIDLQYDSGYGFNTCFRCGLGYRLSPNIDITGAYTTIPEYRKSEKRALLGFQFHSGPLSVRPEVSVGLTGTEKLRSSRMLMNMRYEF